MENNLEDQRDPATVRASLEAISTDRGRIGEKMTAETWWGAPAQGLAVALIVVAPAAGLVWAWLPCVLSLAVFVGVEVLFRKRSGLSITRPAGRRGLWLLVALCFIMFLSFAISMMLALFGLTWWVVAVAVSAGVATAQIVAAYDRAYAAEVRHVG